ncbi:MAG TPA: CPBP family intramembrane glutamic endopeptidase [Terriglobales bacterium]|nr:CPBP family intramembrane glutamic endopeptidase [Terriglobales bacterium]
MDATTPLTSSADQPRYYRLLAPWWHTVLLIAIFLLASAGQAHTLGGIVERHGRLPLYISTIAFEWVMVGFIWLGIRRRGLRLRDLVGGRWKSPEDVLLDIGIALGFWIASIAVLAAVRYALGLVSFNETQNMQQAREISKTLGFLIPQGIREMIVFTALAMTAGFCEELIFRGYLQKQFHAATHNAWISIALQGILFGAGHGYQGVRYMIVIGIYGILFGILAYLRRSLRPGMITHAWQDFSSGLILRALANHLQ